MLAADDGHQRIVVFVLVTVVSDIGGYAVGVFLGKHPMAPSLSPKKSWEGFAGSVGHLRRRRSDRRCHSARRAVVAGRRPRCRRGRGRDHRRPHRVEHQARPRHQGHGHAPPRPRRPHGPPRLARRRAPGRLGAAPLVVPLGLTGVGRDRVAPEIDLTSPETHRPAAPLPGQLTFAGAASRQAAAPPRRPHPRGAQRGRRRALGHRRFRRRAALDPLLRAARRPARGDDRPAQGRPRRARRRPPADPAHPGAHPRRPTAARRSSRSGACSTAPSSSRCSCATRAGSRSASPARRAAA